MPVPDDNTYAEFLEDCEIIAEAVIKETSEDWSDDPCRHESEALDAIGVSVECNYWTFIPSRAVTAAAGLAKEDYAMYQRIRNEALSEEATPEDLDMEIVHRAMCEKAGDLVRQRFHVPGQETIEFPAHA